MNAPHFIEIISYTSGGEKVYAIAHGERIARYFGIPQMVPGIGTITPTGPVATYPTIPLAVLASVDPSVFDWSTSQDTA